MTNKPMLIVERELLERLVKGEPYSNWSALDDDRIQATEELRALLDKPVLESQYEGMTQDQAQAVSDGVDEILHGKPVAQHQGEPVAWYKPHWNGLSAEIRLGSKLYDAAFPEMWHKLYAEQPAPVAVGDDQEFSLCWFEASQQWVVIFPGGKTLTGKFGSMGYAEGAALEYLGLGEADFEVTEDNGSFYRYERDSEVEQ